MGEIADMMLDGFLDEETGEVIDGTSPGYPRRMSSRGKGYTPPATPKGVRTEAQRARAKRKKQRRRERDAAAATAAQQS